MVGPHLSNDDNSPCHQFEIGRFLMACDFQVLFNAGRPTHAGDAAIAALDRIEWLEQTLSVYLPESELSLLNARAAIGEQSISNDVLELLKIGIDVHQKTEGASISPQPASAKRGGSLADKVACRLASKSLRLWPQLARNIFDSTNKSKH